MNEFRLTGTAQGQPTLSDRGKVALFYLKTIRPASGRRKAMAVKIVSFGKTALRCHELIRPGMRIQVFGQITTAIYADKRYMKLGLTREQSLRWIVQLVARDFYFVSTQYDTDRLQIAMDLASSEDWVVFDDRKKENPTSGEGDVGV